METFSNWSAERDKILAIITPVRLSFEKAWQDEGVEPQPDGRVCAGGCCDCWAYRVSDLLHENGYDNLVVHGTFDGKDHWWTELNGDIVIDATADQFGPQFPRVLVGSYSQWNQYRPRKKYS